MEPRLVFLQNSPELAGAQTALLRLLRHTGLKTLRPVALLGRTGWLSEAVQAAGVPFFVQGFPKARSFAGRLYGNHRFGRDCASRLQNYDPSARWIVHANDHPESPLARALARDLGAPSLVILRTPGMSERDFHKYRCGEHNAIIAVGEELYKQAQNWTDSARVRCIHDGLAEEEFFPPSPLSTTFPERIVVLGSGLPRKGWADLAAALRLVAARVPELPASTFTFLGHACGQNLDELLSPGAFPRIRIEHRPRTESFVETVRTFSMAIHPSRSESFGLAALETVAAGVPMLSTRTGVIGQVLPEAWLVPPESPQALADWLIRAIEDWPAMRAAWRDPQPAIRKHFHLDATISAMRELYQEIP